MIEATTAIASSSTVGIAQRAASLRSEQLAADRPKVQPPQAPFISPRVRVDVDLGAIFEIRDSDTGEVVDSFPTQQQLDAFERANTADNLTQVASEEVVTTAASQTSVVALESSTPAPVSDESAAPVQATSILA